MRTFVAFVLTVTVAVASAAFAPASTEVKFADKEFLHKQEDLLLLFRHLYEKDWNPQLVAYARNFHFKESTDLFQHEPTAPWAKKLWAFYEHDGLLPKGEVFSVYDDVHREQAVALFRVLYHAKDWATFYKVAAWARYYVNEGMFVYAVTVAVTHRPDMAGFILPAPYEVSPYHFVNTEVIQRAQQYKMQGYYGMSKVDGVYTATIPSNYTGWYVHTNPEQRLSYFTEDVGLNSYYYYLHTDYPFWLGGEPFGLHKDRRGELYLFEHQQILARYYLERLSNEMGHVPEFSWFTPIETGYYPDLQYYNGHAFPARDNHYHVDQQANFRRVRQVVDYEKRLRDVIDQGFFVLPDGKSVNLSTPESVDVLGNLIQANPDSHENRFYKYVGMYARIILGAAIDPVDSFQAIPSVLEHYETAMRDPVFYQIYERIVGYYHRFKEHLPKYTVGELTFPGVTVDGVVVDKLQTFFDYFDVDVTNAIDIEPEPYVAGKYDGFGEIEYKPDPVVIKARTMRLNHKPFTYRVSLTVEAASKATVRVFLGPKYDEFGGRYTLNENREHFYELDYFVTDLTAGKNVLTRTSTSFNGYVKDRTSFYQLYRTVMAGYTGAEKFPLDMSEARCGFPNRLMLPKGKKGGMPFQLFVIVSPYKAPQVPLFTGFDPVLSCGVGSGARYMDAYALGYPFDRPIDEKVFYGVPNAYFQDVVIFHKPEGDL